MQAEPITITGPQEPETESHDDDCECMWLGRTPDPRLRSVGDQWERDAYEAIARDPKSQAARDVQKTANFLSASAICTLEFWRQQAIPDPTFVYFAAARSAVDHPDGPVKIGFASDPLTRISDLQCGNPQSLMAYELVLADQDLEGYLHRYLRHLRVRGEWFDCSCGPHLLIDRAHNAAVEQVRAYRARNCKMHYLRRELVHPILVPGGRW